MCDGDRASQGSWGSSTLFLGGSLRTCGHLRPGPAALCALGPLSGGRGCLGLGALSCGRTFPLPLPATLCWGRGPQPLVTGPATPSLRQASPSFSRLLPQALGLECSGNLAESKCRNKSLPGWWGLARDTAQGPHAPWTLGPARRTAGLSAHRAGTAPAGHQGRDDAPPPQARQMFAGEMASLEALRGSGLVRAPRPLKILDLPGGGAAFVMEYVKMRGLSSHASKLGEQMADLHLHNQTLWEKSRRGQSTVGGGAAGAEPQHVTKFGFHTVTCCGFIPQVNEWQDDWPTFFTQYRLQAQLDLIEKDYADREARELWSQLQVKIPDLFCGLEIIPALLHGDLWSGNVAEDEAGPIIYDPASFYGHSEFELAIALMFGGFPRSFFSAYHRKIPKAPGFDRRLLLYQLFNYLNHWNHFGREYRGPSLGTMRRLLK